MGFKRLSVLVFTIGSGVALALGMLGSCTNSSFSSGGKSKADNATKKPPKTDDPTDVDDGDGGEPTDLDPGTPNPDVDQDGEPVRTFEDDFKGGFVTKPLDPEQRSYLWTVTVDGVVNLFQLDGKTVKTKKTWTGATGGGGGSRTYVTEGGLVVARTGGHLFFIDPEATPEGALPRTSPTYYKLNGPGGADRVCVVSYRRDKKRYLGMGYGAGKFVEVAMNNTAPFAPKWTEVTGQANASTPSWGYSCYIDQQKLVYYSQFVGNKPAAVDLKTMQNVAPEARAPNASFRSTSLPQATVSTNAGGSYAMNGDRDGNLFNGTGYYTMAYEPESKTVWGASGGMLNIIPTRCLTKDASCSGNGSFNMAQLNALVGPMSAFGDGNMVGLFRGSPGQVYMMSLKDKKDVSKGVDVTRITDLPGDPYMYTDFTGATLYLTKTENTFDLTESESFDAKKTNKAIGFAWAPRPDASKKWRHIKLELRCYKAGERKGTYDEVENVKDASGMTFVTVGGCKDAKYDRVDVRLTQLDDEDTLMGVQKVQITAYK